MIVSASFRTDIPAFYPEWFQNRFRAGFARVINPYSGKPGTVALRQGVDGFVFWTRNAGPFLPVLAEVARAGIPFVVQYTVTGYPKALEPSVIPAERSIELIRRLAGEFGPRAVVWRYDPVVTTSLTPLEFHPGNFARIADGLSGTVDEAAASFANIYQKTRRTMDAAARAHGLSWSDPDDGDKRHLLADLALLAAQRGMALTVCSQAHSIGPGTTGAVGIEARRLEDVAKGWGLIRAIKAKQKGNRPDCLCHESRDIGDYDTCPHGCTYCYAVRSRTLAKQRFRAHDPGGEFLFPMSGAPRTEPTLL